MELKVECNCGQKYKFDVEPVNGLMPFVVNCPSCGVDGTASANTMIGQLSSVPPPPPPAATGLRINRHETAPAPAARPMTAPPIVPAPLATPKPFAPAAAPARPKQAGEFNMGMGVLGAFLGAGVGAGLIFGFSVMAGFRFPLLGVGIGALTGFTAKLFYKGTSNGLGYISGGIALVAVVATLFLIYGGFPIFNIISVLVSVSMAYRIASG